MKKILYYIISKNLIAGELETVRRYPFGSPVIPDAYFSLQRAETNLRYIRMGNDENLFSFEISNTPIK